MPDGNANTPNTPVQNESNWLLDLINQNPDIANAKAVNPAPDVYRQATLGVTGSSPIVSNEQQLKERQQFLSNQVLKHQNEIKQAAVIKQQQRQKELADAQAQDTMLTQRAKDLYGGDLPDDQLQSVKAALKSSFDAEQKQQKQKAIDAIPLPKLKRETGWDEIKAKAAATTFTPTGSPADMFRKAPADYSKIIDKNGEPTQYFKETVAQYPAEDRRKVAQAMIAGEYDRYQKAPVAFAEAMQHLNNQLHDNPATRPLSYVMQTAGATGRGLLQMGALGANILENVVDPNQTFGAGMADKMETINQLAPDMTPDKEQGTLDKLFGGMSRATGEYILSGMADVPGFGIIGHSTAASDALKGLGKSLTTDAEKSAFMDATGQMAIPRLAQSGTNQLAAEASNIVSNLSGSKAVKFLDNTAGFLKGAGAQLYTGYYDQLIKQGYTPQEASKKAFTRTVVNAVAMGGLRNFIEPAGIDMKGAAKELLSPSAESSLSKGLDLVKRHGIGVAKNAAFGSIEGMSGSIADQWQDFHDAKDRGELPDDASFDWSHAFNQAKEPAVVNGLMGAIMGTVNGHGVAPKDPQAHAIVSALSDRGQFEQTLYRQAARGEVHPDDVQAVTGFLDKVHPEFEQALQAGKDPATSAKIAVESARLKEAEQAHAIAPTPELEQKIIDSRRTLTQLENGTYIKGRMVDADEMKRISQAKPAQEKQITDNAPYQSEQVDITKYANDPDVKKYITVVGNPEDVAAYIEQLDKLKAERAAITDKYKEKKDANGEIIKTGSEPTEEDATKINELNRQITEHRRQYPNFKDAEDMIGFIPAGEAPPVLDEKGDIVDGKKRIAYNLAHGITEMEVAKPVNNEQVDEQLANSKNDIIGSTEPNDTGLSDTDKEHLTGAADAFNQHADISDGYTAAAKHLIDAGLKRGKAIDLLQRVTNGNISRPQAEQFYNSVKRGTRKVVQPEVPQVEQTGEDLINQYLPKEETTSEKQPVIEARHGLTNEDKASVVSGQSDIGLNKQGRAKANQLAESMKDKGIDRIVTSDLPRARQTADIVAKKTGAVVEDNPGLRSWDVGDFEQSDDAAFKKAQRYFVDHPDDVEYEGKKLGESFNQFKDRVVAARDAIIEPGTMIINHSTNIELSNAIKDNGGWNAATKEQFLSHPAPEPATIVEEAAPVVKEEQSGTINDNEHPDAAAEALQGSYDRLIASGTPPGELKSLKEKIDQLKNKQDESVSISQTEGVSLRESPGNSEEMGRGISQPEEPAEQGATSGKSTEAQTEQQAQPVNKVYFEHAGMDKSGDIIREEGKNYKIRDTKGIIYTIPKDEVSEQPHQFKEPETKEESKTFADKVIAYGEKLKKNKSALGTIVPITPELMGRSLVVIGKTLKAGESLARAIKNGIRYVRANMKDKFDESTYEAEVRRHFKEATRPPLKTEIKEAVKSRVGGGDEYENLKSQLRIEAKAAREGFKSGVEEGKVTGKEQGVKEGVKQQSAIQKEFAGRIAQHLKDALTSGVITDSQAKTLMTKAADVGTSEAKLISFLDQADKVLMAATKRQQVQDGYGYRDKIRKAIKGDTKAANNKDVVKQFLQIDPGKVDDVPEYNDIAQKVLTNSRSLSARLNDGDVSVSNDTYEANNKEIEGYVQRQMQHAEQVAKDRLADIYDDMVGSGILDPEKMSLGEMQDILSAIHGDPKDGEPLITSAEKDRVKKDAVREVVEYQKMGLLDHVDDPVNNLDEQQKEIADSLIDIDTSKLDLKQLIKLNDVINNIITNNDFHDAGNIAAIGDAQRNTAVALDKIDKSGIPLGSINNAFAKGFTSINLMTEFITKSTKLAAEVQRLSGISGIFNGHAKAKILQNETIKEYLKLKKTLPKDIDNAENRYRRGIYARVIQDFGGSESERLQEFERAKGLIQQTADRMMQSGINREMQEGRLLDQLYHEMLDKATSVNDVQIDAANKKLVDFWQDKFAQRKDLVARNAEMYDNILWEDVNNYTPTSMKAVKGVEHGEKEAELDIFADRFYSKKIDNTPAGTKQQRLRNSVLPKGRGLDLDFDKLMSQKYYETNYDVETNKAIAEARAFFNNPESSKVLGNVTNKQIMQDAVRKAVLSQKGKHPDVEPWEKVVTAAANVLQAKGARIALGSVSQALKQYPSVAFNTLLNLGKDMPLYVRAIQAGTNLPLFDKFNIGLRGETKAGYNKEVDLGEIDRAQFGNDVQKAVKTVGEVGKKLGEYALATLEKSDVLVARHSWLAYYMQDLQRQGINLDDVNWKQEHINPNEEAAAYAEQQVSRTQNPNDPSSMANFTRDSKGVKGVFKNIVAPFSSFAMNQRARMTNDAQKMMFGGESKEAARSMAATVAEQALFNALKVYVIGKLTTMGAQGIASMFGYWDDKDQDKFDQSQDMSINGLPVSRNFKKFVGNTMSDIFFSGMGGVTQTTLQQGVANPLYKLVVNEQNYKGDEVKDPKLFYNYNPSKTGDQDFAPWGIYGTPLEQVYRLGKTGSIALTGQTDRYTKGGYEGHTETERADVTDEERAAYTLSFFIDALALTGASDAEISVMNKKLQNIMQQKMTERYGGPAGLIYRKGKGEKE